MPSAENMKVKCAILCCVFILSMQGIVSEKSVREAVQKSESLSAIRNLEKSLHEEYRTIAANTKYEENITLESHEKDVSSNTDKNEVIENVSVFDKQLEKRTEDLNHTLNCSECFVREISVDRHSSEHSNLETEVQPVTSRETADYMHDAAHEEYFFNETLNQNVLNTSMLETGLFIEKKPQRKKKKKKINKSDDKQSLVFPLAKDMIDKVKLRQHRKKISELKEYRKKLGINTDDSHKDEKCLSSSDGTVFCYNSQVSDKSDVAEVFLEPKAQQYGKGYTSITELPSTKFPYFGPPVTRRVMNPITESINPFKVIHQGFDSIHRNMIRPSDSDTFPETVGVENTLGDKSSIIHSLSNSTSRKGVNSTEGSKEKWPYHAICETEGDIILGALMMVHERDDKQTCGKIMPQGGVQALETMLFTLDHINRKGFIPNITLGAFIHDDCDQDSYGLEKAVDFIKVLVKWILPLLMVAGCLALEADSPPISIHPWQGTARMEGSISNIDDGEYRCNDGSSPKIRNKVIDGVVGAASSVTSIQVANLLRLFKIPQVSFFSTSPELSNKQRFEYFSRTIPSDHHQVKAMVKIVVELNWSYISIIYEESNYGIKAFEQLQDLLPAYGVCIAVKEKLVKDSGVAGEEAYDRIVKSLLKKSRARGVIVFASDQEVAEVMKAVKRNDAENAFSWIGSDGWSMRSLVSKGNENVVEGTLSVQPQANIVKGFKEYFTSLTVENNKRNPWFFEYWEDHFECKYPNRSFTPYNKNYITNCTGKERLSPEGTPIEAQLQFVSDAVMAFAYAFRDLHEEKCGSTPGRCKGKMDKINGEELLAKLRKVEFEGLSGDSFNFDEAGDGPARYRVIHFKKISDSNWGWVEVGNYSNGELYLNKSQVQFRHNESMPSSVCTEECIMGQAKKVVEGETCCWHCTDCNRFQIVERETSCVYCPQFKLPSSDQTVCVDIPEVYIELQSWNAIIPMITSSIGLVSTCLTLSVFIKHNNTPVVKASGRELSYVLLGGIFLSNAMTFIFVLKPTDFVCGIQRFGLGLCFAIIYSALLTKTNRISRIFNSGRKTRRRPSLISPLSQILICTGFVLIQVFITIVWIVILPPAAVNFAITRTDNFLVCTGSNDASYTTAFIYPIMLVLTCTIYAWTTRKIPEAFNESKHIGFTMYTTCIIWLAFVPIYYTTANDNKMRITTIAVTTSMSGCVALVCLFFPKVYIIIFHPERNQRLSKVTGPRLQSMRSTHQNTILSHTAAVTILRVDTSTQSEAVVPPPSLCLAETNGAELGGVYIGETNLSCAAVSTQTCGSCNADDNHQCEHSHVLEASKCNGSVRQRVLNQGNGPLQDVPDVML